MPKADDFWNEMGNVVLHNQFAIAALNGMLSSGEFFALIEEETLKDLCRTSWRVADEMMRIRPDPNRSPSWSGHEEPPRPLGVPAVPPAEGEEL